MGRPLFENVGFLVLMRRFLDVLDHGPASVFVTKRSPVHHGDVPLVDQGQVRSHLRRLKSGVEVAYGGFLLLSQDHFVLADVPEGIVLEVILISAHTAVSCVHTKTIGLQESILVLGGSGWFDTVPVLRGKVS